MDIEKTRTNPPREKLIFLWNSVQRIVSDSVVEESKPSEEHENRIRRHYNLLISNLSVPDIEARMFTSGKLTLKEHEHLRQFHPTPIRASEELLTILMVKSRDVFDCFLKLLNETKQHHVYQMLTLNEEIACTDGQSVFEHSRIIRKNYDWLTEKIDCDSGLLTTLYAKDVLSKREFSQIIVEKEQFVKNDLLLSIISRKSVEDFENFKIVLSETLQEHVTKRLTEKPVGDESKSELNKPPPTSFSSKPEIDDTSDTHRMEKQKYAIQHKIVKKRSVKCLEAKLRGLSNELETEISAKLFVIDRKKSTTSIWTISFTKMLEESRNIKTQNMVQAKAADEKCERLMQEITETKKQLEERQETLNNLGDRFEQIKRENKSLLEKLEANEFKVTVLHQEVVEEENKRANINGQLRNHEIKLEETEALLKATQAKLTEKDEILKQITTTLEEAQGTLMETETKKNEFQATLIAAERSIDDLKMLNQRKEKEVIEKESIIEQLRNQVIWSEELVKQREAELINEEELYKKSELDFNLTTKTLRETLEKLKDAKAKLKESEEKLQMTENDFDQLKLRVEFRYNSDPVLIQTIITNSDRKRKLWFRAAEESKFIRGMTILEKKLFVATDQSSEVNVYDTKDFSFSRRWNLKELIYPKDIVACDKNNCLYIFNQRGLSQPNQILRVDSFGKLINSWSTGDDWGYGMSVTDESNVILAVSELNKLNEYSPDGHLIRNINLSSGLCTGPLLHAIKLTSGHFVILCQSGLSLEKLLYSVCIVDEEGKLKKSFWGKRGSFIEQINNPIHMSVDVNGVVMVVDKENSRVLLLDSDLQFRSEILSKERHGLRHPERILLDESNNRLLVADNEPYNQRILIFSMTN